MTSFVFAFQNPYKSVDACGSFPPCFSNYVMLAALDSFHFLNHWFDDQCRTEQIMKSLEPELCLPMML